MRRSISLILAVVMTLSICMPLAFAAEANKVRLIVPENWEMDIGDSRTVDYAFSEGTKDRSLTWVSSDEKTASVDAWGRVTGVSEGTATITASTKSGATSSVTVKIVAEATKIVKKTTKVDYAGKAVKETVNLQKEVKRYGIGSKAVPGQVADKSNYDSAKTAVTSDGAKWEITSYGVLRTDEKAANERDKEQRFMGDRYFYSADTGDGKVLAIFPDGDNGIWTVMEDGYTHIAMVEMNGTQKAAKMSDNTQEVVSRRGMVSEAYKSGGEWIPDESDNDGLWTAMYGAGELMRYAVLKESGTASQEEIAAAKKTAYQSVEAVLLLTYISMREGTVESYVRRQRNGTVADLDIGKYYSDGALIEGGDDSANVPFESPAFMFDSMHKKFLAPIPKYTYTMDSNNLSPFVPSDWVDPKVDDTVTYAKRTRNLEGFWSRTYSLKSEKEAHGDYGGYIYWSHNGDGTATGVSTRPETSSGYYLNGENLRGVKVNATKAIPQRLWDDLIGSGYDISDIVYKGDTSADEIIGHLFLYKLAYDILGPEDEEIKNLIITTMDLFAQHIVDNSYTLCDGSGQPTTWGKFSRTYLHNGQVLGGAPLQTLVCLSALKVAAYVTGDKKWEDEYRMAALDPQYEYAKIMTQQRERYEMAIFEYGNSVSKAVGLLLRSLRNTKFFRIVNRLILNYSDEEMAMLGYYLLFQLEDDDELLGYFREGLEDWWYSMSFSENPLWYYIYQLAHPDEEMKDAYGNSLIETASWSLSRHPVSLIKYLASNTNRDDIAEVNLEDVGIDGTEPLSYDLTAKKPLFYKSNNNIIRLIGIVLSATKLKWAVAAPDERALHKFNGSTYVLNSSYNPNCCEGSTTYTLPYWMGRYHNMLVE